MDLGYVVSFLGGVIVGAVAGLLIIRNNIKTMKKVNDQMQKTIDALKGKVK